MSKKRVSSLISAFRLALGDHRKQIVGHSVAVSIVVVFLILQFLFDPEVMPDRYTYGMLLVGAASPTILLYELISLTRKHLSDGRN